MLSSDGEIIISTIVICLYLETLLCWLAAPLCRPLIFMKHRAIEACHSQSDLLASAELRPGEHVLLIRIPARAAAAKISSLDGCFDPHYYSCFLFSLIGRALLMLALNLRCASAA